jgi:integrase
MIPKRLRAAWGMSVIKRSLHTTHPATARLRAQTLALRYALAIAAGERVEMSAKHWDDDAVNEVMRSIQANTDGRGVSKWKMKLPSGVEIDTGGDTPEHHRQGMEALAAAAAIFAAQPLATPSPATPASAGPTLAEAMQNYASVEAMKLRPNTWTQRQRAFKSFAAQIGEGVRVGAITREMSSRWADGLIRAGQSHITAANSVSHVAQLFAALKKKGVITGENPVKGLVEVKPRDKAQRRAEGHEWEAFEVEQLKRIFDPANFARAGQEHVRWGALIALYTGARVGEIAQLFCRDFVTHDKVKCILFRADSDGQSIKTGEAGERLVPIHPDLLALGLWERVGKIAWEHRAKKEMRVFPGMHIDSKSGKGNAISKGFTYYLGKLNITPRRANGKVGMHSFRDTVIQTLQGTSLPEERRRALVGHEKGLSGGGHDSHSSNYMRPWLPKELTAYWRGLKWGKWLDFDGLKPLLQTITLTPRPKPRPRRKKP